MSIVRSPKRGDTLMLLVSETAHAEKSTEKAPSILRLTRHYMFSVGTCCISLKLEEVIGQRVLKPHARPIGV
jgi:hypothetical protein